MPNPRQHGKTRSAPPRTRRGRPARARISAKSNRTHEFTDASKGRRLQKVLAEAGVGSRRHCEELIEAGVVKVNGHAVQSLPAWVDPAKDHVTVDGKSIKRAQSSIYVMLFKPRG